MTGQERAFATEARGLAQAIEAHHPDILAAYRLGLETAGIAIVRDLAAFRQASKHATQILADVNASLLRGSVQVDESHRLLAWDIGVARAAEGVHPRESLQASSVFFHTALSKIAEYVTQFERALELFTLVAVTLERSIALRIRESSAAYTSFLLNRVHEAQVDERRRIARELHDRIGHGINVAHRQLELYSLYRADEPAKASVKVETAQRAVVDSMHNLRAVTSDLHRHEPLRSLEKALLRFLETADTTGVTVRLRVNGNESWASPEVLDECFLILREAARNALGHARPGMLLMNVDITPNELRASVEDDGLGFDTRRPPASGGVGLVGMRERVELMNGTVVISSEPGQGTQVCFSVPLVQPPRPSDQEPGEDDMDVDDMDS